MADLTSALHPTNDHAKKIWNLAYSELLSRRYISGRTFENFDQIQIARGIAPLSDADRHAYVDDFIEHVTDRVNAIRGAWDFEEIKKTIARENAAEAAIRSHGPVAEMT
jgi:hypothetical protein